MRRPRQREQINLKYNEMDNSNDKKIAVQYGCGFSSPVGWMNFDSSPTLRFERIPLIGRFYTRNAQRFPDGVNFGNVVSGLPFRDDSVDLLYCSHVLEHLALEEFKDALTESFRILRPGGVFRLVLPCLENAIKAYSESKEASASIQLLKSTLLGVENRRRDLKGFFQDWLGGSKHLWMWDYKGMEAELKLAGFVGVRRAQFGDSDHSEFAEVEDEDRWTGHLGVECYKGERKDQQ